MSFLTRRRQTAVECFFCLSPSILAPLQDPQHWKCERCGCLNARDGQGNIKSVDPAMRDPELNKHSFALRAAPSSSRIPSKLKASPFCQGCLTNQTLITNLLANYLPDDSDPTYPSLYANLDHYVANLHARYPPVCAQCQPAVDAALKKSDYRAQAGAWAGLLKRSDGRQIEPSAAETFKEDTWDQVLLWRARGLLFCTGCMASAVLGLSVASVEKLASITRSKSVATASLAFHVLSIGWIAWDPYWLRRVRSSGRVKVVGRATWVRNMLGIMVLRIISSTALLLSFDGRIPLVQTMTVLELLVFTHAVMSLRLKHPLPVRLIRSKPDLREQASSPPPPFTTPTLSTLSLSHQPLSTHHNPIFGRQTIPTPMQESASEAEPMEWEPDPSAVIANGGWTGPNAPVPERSDWDSFAIGRQRMFPRTAETTGETGLESLLEGWGIGGGGTSGMAVAVESQPAKVPRSQSSDDHLVRTWVILSLLRCLTVAIGTFPASLIPPALVGRNLTPWMSSLETALAVICLVYLALAPPSLSQNRGKRVAAFCASLAAHIVTYFITTPPFHHIASILPIITDIGQVFAWQ